MEKGHPCYRGTVMRYHSTGALICDGAVVSTTLRGPRILADTILLSERWKLTTAPGEYVSISSTFIAEIAKN